MEFVLDNSVSMRWFFGDGSSEEQTYAQRVLASIRNAIVWAPGIWCLEVANVIGRAESKHGFSEARSVEFTQALHQLNIQIDHATCFHVINDTLHLGRRYKLSAYDAAYLELALRKGYPLATLDDGLEKAIKKSGAKKFVP